MDSPSHSLPHRASFVVRNTAQGGHSGALSILRFANSSRAGSGKGTTYYRYISDWTSPNPSGKCLGIFSLWLERWRGGLYTSLGLFHVYSGSRACLLKVVTRTPTVLSLLPPKEIGGGRRANNEEKAEMEAKRARDLEGKKVACPLSLFPSSIPRFLLPSTPG